MSDRDGKSSREISSAICSCLARHVDSVRGSVPEYLLHATRQGVQLHSHPGTLTSLVCHSPKSYERRGIFSQVSCCRYAYRDAGGGRVEALCKPVDTARGATMRTRGPPQAGRLPAGVQNERYRQRCWPSGEKIERRYAPPVRASRLSARDRRHEIVCRRMKILSEPQSLSTGLILSVPTQLVARATEHILRK